LHGKRLAVELIVHVLACVAEGLGIRATARVFEVDPNTVLQWLVEAAEQLQAFTRYFHCDGSCTFSVRVIPQLARGCSHYPSSETPSHRAILCPVFS
jgi:hypothetical protein